MPNTNNIALNIPATGDLPGAWGTTAVNANMTVVDGILAGSQAISLTGSSATTLAIATGVIGTGSISPGAGPTQSANRVIAFSGTLSSNCVVTMPRPGSWIVKNGCIVGSFSLQMRATGTGNLIGLPPGEAIEVYCDGTNMDFVGLGRVGSYMRLAVTATPAWMSACTVLPYLPCNSSTVTYLISTYPALGASLGSTFGGNGVTTFGVPDKTNKVGVPIGALLTSGNCGFDGSALGASGGTTSLQSHSHTAVSSVTDPGHVHSIVANGTISRGGSDKCADETNQTTSMATQTATTNITVSTAIGTTGVGNSGNVQPTIIDGIEFIRAG